MVRVFVPGTYEFCHEGHMQLLKDAFKLSDDVEVLVNGDEMISERKPGVVKRKARDRADDVSIFLYEKYSPKISVVKSLDEIKQRLIANSAIVLHGDDYDIHSLSKLYGVDESWWRMHGILPVFTPRQTGMSSTQLRKKRK